MSNAARIAIAKEAVISALAELSPHIVDNIDETALEVVGSTYIADCTTSDVDVLCRVPVPVAEVSFYGWEFGGSVGIGNDRWGSWKRDVDGVTVNMLLCSEQRYIDNWLLAAEVCRLVYLGAQQRDCNDFRNGLPRALVHAVHELIMEDADAATCAEVYNYG